MIDPIKVLLVDDSKVDYQLIDETLSRITGGNPYILDWEKDYEAALIEIPKKRYAIYLIDYNLNDNRTGLDLVKASVKKGGNGPFVFLTGQECDDIKNNMQVGGTRCYLLKEKLSPVLLNGVIARVLKDNVEKNTVQTKIDDTNTAGDDLILVDRPKKVLLVEDNLIDVKLFLDICEACGTRVEVVNKVGIDLAAEALKETTFSVVFLDLNVRDSMGPDTVGKIRKLAPKTPIVVMTGLGNKDTLNNCRKQGADDFMLKQDITPERIALFLQAAK